MRPVAAGAVGAASGAAVGAGGPGTVVLVAVVSGVESGQRDAGFESAASSLQARIQPFLSCQAYQMWLSPVSPNLAPS